MARDQSLTGNERYFAESDYIVSKTDLKGKLTYVNREFMNIADYDEKELIGQPHNIIRNPEMPRCIFKRMWDALQSSREIFAYVVNRCKNGDHYWVLAHVTPSLDGSGNVVGYHSTRRVPDKSIVQNTIIPLYRQLCEVENACANRKDGMKNSDKAVDDMLKKRGISYDQWIFAL